MEVQRQAPFPLSKTDVVDESGGWSPKHNYEFVNNFIPVLLVYAHCNHDAKLLTNGDVTMKVVWYITKYATKCQQKCSNTSALLAEGLAFHFSDEKHIHDIHQHSRLLLFQSYHSINRHSEQLAPQVMSYLMGWGDSKYSHQYVPLYWSSIVQFLVLMFPELQQHLKSVFK